VRMLGAVGVWLAVQTGCGGNPAVNPDDGDGTDGGTSSGGGAGKANGGTGGLVIGMGGDSDPGTGGTSGSGGGPVSYDCGNAELEPGEFCDDGNTKNGDGCSGDCQQVDPDYDCSAVGEPCTLVVICGNSTVEGSEVCDDGNMDDDDGCAGDCREVESGWACIRPGRPCVKIPVCGNGEKERGEECDGGDSCDDECKLIKNYRCGDGTRNPGELCDDGNEVAGDGCAVDCTSVEDGWYCGTTGCKPLCGDGKALGTEECDDGNAISGDGCSARCKVEPYFTCMGKTPSTCQLATECGNGELEPIFMLEGGVYKKVDQELCDPPASKGGDPSCNDGCTSVSVVEKPPVCGDKVVSGNEKCENIAGVDCPACAAACVNCQVTPGYTCPQPGYCFRNPECGDGVRNPGEQCDDKNKVSGDGCSSACQVESGYDCALEPSVCVKPVCGNGQVEAGEKCDDGNQNASDGCNACNVTNGWVCPSPGAACLTKCGDGLKLGIEGCDDGNKVSGDGCNAACIVEPGYKCPNQNQVCVASVCGDGSKDAGEGCDDGNKVAADGCGPTCQPEPTVTVGPNPSVAVACGDGLKVGAEQCDDGNTADGDGCDSDCLIEDGWKCTSKLTLPPTVTMQVQYRDFKKDNSSGGHPDFEFQVRSALGVAGPVCTRNNSGQCTAAAGAACTAGTCGTLDSAGKPVLHLLNSASAAAVTSADSYSLWYRSTNSLQGTLSNVGIFPITGSLELKQIGGADSEVYQFLLPNNQMFFPLDGQGFGNDGNTRNFHFTTELRYFFQYKGGETLSFRGDDDVWVFINGRLAVDIGGVHGVKYGRVVLGDDGGAGATDSNCTANLADNPPGACALEANETASNDDQRFGLVKGSVYEIAFFQAERHTTESNFELTLAGFLAPRSFCESTCGDGKKVGGEFCDDGANNSDTASGACKTDCTARNFCGDGVRQLPGEACDNGVNTDLYKTPQSAPSVCAPGCKIPPSCGDGVVQASQEDCDKGAQNDDSAYGPNECKKDCKLGGYCGDGIAQTDDGEVCDKGANNGQGYENGACGFDCQLGPRCGDGIINGPAGVEKCDDGANNGQPGKRCSATCTVVPGCGDGLVQSGEQCDDGSFNSVPPAMTPYGGCSNMCVLGPFCGDGMLQSSEEECDNGIGNNNTTYGGCTLACTLGPRCGDGVKQATEECDNGFNEDTYDDPRLEGECAPGCKLPKQTCGDGMLQSIEECDDGTNNKPGEAYDACTLECKYGPFCGDGVKNGPETCDNGSKNTFYAAKKGACSYECEPAPWCGDGERNGPEQCDLGEDGNTGDYGKCNADCTFAPRCGDGKIDKGEECDDGPTGSLKCLATCKLRPVVQ
jgi:fibro-slime domain-containing protein